MRKLLILTLVLLTPALGQAQGRGLVLEAEEIIGTVQKPEIQVIVSKGDLDQGYDLELKESFIPKIIQSIEADPF